MQQNLLVKYGFTYLLVVAFVFLANGIQAQTSSSKTDHGIKAGCTPDSTIFTGTGSLQTFTVPCGVYSITVKCWGAGGGGGGTDGSGTPAAGGGGGAFAMSTFAVAPLTALSVYVGMAGGAGPGCQTGTGGGAGGFGLGNGGNGGNPGNSGCSGPGGGGGGGTGIKNGATVLIVAGGGGGSGGGETNVTFAGDGGGGGVAGSPGNSSFGGSLSASGTNNGISAGMPANDNPGTGGGGGGLLGGGCGTVVSAPANSTGGGGGAGGTSMGTTVINGAVITPGNSAYPSLCAGCAKGGVTSSIGGNGYMVISYCLPPPLTVTAATTNASCGNANGSATANAAGGTPPYTYSWSSGQTASSETNLTAGAYTITVTDAGGCVTPVTFTIGTTAGMRDSVVSFTNATCNPTGTANTGLKGGTAPYTYSWTNGETSSNATALSVGSYTLTVTDASGCTTTATVTIGGSPPIRDSIVSFTNVSVACGSNGTANAGVKGGTTPYTYAWSDGQTVTNATNLSAGVYTFTVTDANGCTANTTVTIAQPGALTASITGTTPALCNGGATGTASGTVTGGNPAYTYSWSNGETGTTATALTAGVYTFSVTDANGCTVTATATVTQPSILRDSISASSNISCNGGNDGTATVGVEGGSSPYTYAWSNTGTTSAITALTAGTYNVNITDANGCPGTASVTLTQPPVLSLTSGAFNATCFNVCNGQASVIPAGGTPPYSYSWSTGATTAALLNLCIGTYTITVTDAKGCQHDTSLTIAQPPQIVITKNPPTTAHCNQADGSGSVSATGGTGALSYAWSNGQTGTNITNVKPGSYCVTVTDANGCTDTACIVVPNQLGVIASITATTNVTCNGGNDGSITGNATSGTAPYTYSWNTVPPQLTATATNLTAGSYTLTVTDATGCTDTAVATITQPALVVASTSAPVTICIGQTATLTATAVGGTSPYTFTWSNGTTASSDPVTPATTTTYTVNTVDVNGCPGAPVPVVVTVNPALSVVAGAPQAMCPGGTVNLSATGSGGDGVYTYTWNPITVPATGSPVTASPAVTTIYTVTVQDGCGTPQATATETVTVYPLPVISFTVDTTNGCYPLCVNFTDATTIASGTLQSWAWSFGDGNTSTSQNTKDCYQNPGSYSIGLTVTSNEGCISSVSLPNMITAYSHPVAQFTWTPNPVSTMYPTVTFIDESTDAYGISNWYWPTFGDGTDSISLSQNPSHTYGDTGTYCPQLIVTNVHGCTDSITECVIVNPFFTLYIPNSFTPNGDGKNDTFQPVGQYIGAFEMHIFDRWGQELYHTLDIHKGWNGFVGSNLCQQDTYIYTIEVNDLKGNASSYIGRVTLIQ